MDKEFQVIYPNEVSRELFLTSQRSDFFKSDYFETYFQKEIDRLALENKKFVVSCDIFDTVLLRNNKCEPFRFYEISKAIKNQLNLSNSVYEILIARYLGTDISYSASSVVKGCREGSLVDIHKSLLNALNVDKTKFEKSIEAELAYEKENLELNEGFWNVLKNSKEKYDFDIIFISDTYKHSEQIEELLKHFIIEYPQCVAKLYSSADLTVSKHSSAIYDYVIEDLNLKANQLLHIGDNLGSDYQNPKKKGWNAMYLPIPKYQQELIRENLINFKAKLDNDGINIKLINRLFN